MTNQLVFINEECTEPYTNTMVISNETGNEHESVVRLLNTYSQEFSQLGLIRFSDLKSGNPLGGRPQKIGLLNELQATFLITLLKNTTVVIAFKLELVKQFYTMRTMLQKTSSVNFYALREQLKAEIMQELRENLSVALTGKNAKKCKECRKKTTYTAYTMRQWNDIAADILSLCDFSLSRCAWLWVNPSQINKLLRADHKPEIIGRVIKLMQKSYDIELKRTKNGVRYLLPIKTES